MAEDRLAKMRELVAQARAEKEAKEKESAERARSERESAEAAQEAERSQVEAELGQAQGDLSNLEAQLGEATQLMDQSADLPEEVRATLQGELAQLEADMQAVRARVAELAQRKAGLDTGLGAETPTTEIAPQQPEASATEEAVAEEIPFAQTRDARVAELSAEYKGPQTVDSYRVGILAEEYKDPAKREAAIADIRDHGKESSKEFSDAQHAYGRAVLDTLNPGWKEKIVADGRKGGLSDTTIEADVQATIAKAAEGKQIRGTGFELPRDFKKLSKDKQESVARAIADFAPHVVAEWQRLKGVEEKYAALRKRADEGLLEPQLGYEKSGEYYQSDLIKLQNSMRSKLDVALRVLEDHKRGGKANK